MYFIIFLYMESPNQVTSRNINDELGSMKPTADRPEIKKAINGEQSGNMNIKINGPLFNYL